MDQGNDVDKMVSLLQGMRDDMKDFKRSSHMTSTQTPNSSSNVSFNVQGGGLGFRLVVMACLVQLVLTVCAMGFMLYVSTHQDANIAEMQVSQNRQQDYLNIILQWAPELRKKIEETRNKP